MFQAIFQCVSNLVQKDTVTTNEEYDVIDAHNHTEGADPSVRLNAVVHHLVPILAGQDLKQQRYHQKVSFEKPL